MEKQPVDDLFARKLRDVEAPVGPDVFNQLQKRIGTKPLPVRRPIVAWWYAASAACVLVAVWFVYITTGTEQPISVPVAQKQSQSLKKSKPVAVPTEDPVATVTVNEQQKRDVSSNASDPESNKEMVRVTYPDQETDASAGKSIRKEPVPDQNQPAERVAVVQTQEKEIQPVLNTPTPTPIATADERIERPEAKQKQTADRTIVLTIEEPQAANRLVTTQSDSPTPDPQQKGLSGLLGKIKQLKNGEVLAKVTPPTNHNNPKNRFGRIFTEMRESLKNETTLE